MKHPVEEFINLGKDAKNVCFLYTGGTKGKSILAKNPVEKFVYKSKKGKSFLQPLKSFIKRNLKRKCKIIGYFSYDLGYELHDIKKTATDEIGRAHV